MPVSYTHLPVYAEPVNQQLRQMTGSDNERSSDEEMACTPVFGINGVRHLLEADKTERYRQTYSDNNAVC